MKRGGRLVLVFGDQLSHDYEALQGLGQGDVVLMVEVAEESRHVPTHVQRTVFFLSAMRHFAQELRDRGVKVRYVNLDDAANTQSFEGEILRAAREIKPRELVCTQPGEWRVLRMVEAAAEVLEDEFGTTLSVLPDTHFLTSDEQFAAWADGRASLTMEYFYREQRKRLNILMRDGKPEGGEWNLDKSNRESFGKTGPGLSVPAAPWFEPDAITREVAAAVGKMLPDLPGAKDARFAWGVTRADALKALKDFVANRLADFGPFEDAMWSSEPTLYHSALSPYLNVKLLSPRECVDAALKAFRGGRAPLQSVEGFVRQLIGWREYIRGVYWFEGPGYEKRNGLDHQGALPEFYWHGRVDMNCMKGCVAGVVERAWNHHIPRLMVMGNFALLVGVHPKQVSDWFLGMFIDGVDWVTLPNTLGMSQYADWRSSEPGARLVGGAVVGTKPYISGGRYIDGMSDYCRGCKYDPAKRTGETACPFSTLYWDFLLRHRDRLKGNQRMGIVLKSADKIAQAERVEITVSARRIRERYGVEGPKAASYRAP